MKFPCKRSFSYLSNYTQMASDSLDWSVAAGEIEDACAAERLDFMSDLNSVLLGKLPRFLLKKNIHLPSLSMETILESQFVDDFTVKKILSEVNKEWLKTKPLQLVGSNIVGKSFVDKPPKRVMMTNLSVEDCQKAFKGQVCDYLTDFCQLLNSDELLSFFMEDVVDTSAKRRFDHFKHQLEKNVEKWCDDLKKTDFPLKGLSITLQKQTGKSEKHSKKPEYDISIERELDEIIRSQLTKFDEDGPATKRRRTCANQSLDLEDVLNAQMMNANSAYDDKARGSSVENLSPTRTNLEKEFDVFTEELASFCGNKETKKGIDNLYSPIHHIEDNLYETFEDSIVMANINKTSVNKRDEHTDDNESFGGDGFDKNGCAVSKSKVVSRSIRKKRLDKEDQHESNQKRHKRKKEDKKHKLKKRKKNKHKDVENVKGKILTFKSDERGGMHQDNIRDLPSEKFDTKVLSRVNKTFEPDMKLYEDSHLSCGFDVYQKQKIMELLDTNFEAEFDPTLPPGEACESPLMQLFTDSSGVMEQFVGIIPDIRQFCADLVNSKNAFLWALSLATLDPGVPTKINDDENLKKQSAKTTGNPLIQAFRQAVEANKKKDDRVSKSAYLKRGMNQPKISFKSTGLSSLFRLNSNLKASSKEIISSAYNNFHDEVTDFAKTENFADSRPAVELDFSAISTHFEKASQAMHGLYAASEENLSSRSSTKKQLIMMSNVDIISTADNMPNGNMVDMQADSSTASFAQPADHQNSADSTVTVAQTEAQLIASAAYANYVTSCSTSAASSKVYTPASNYTTSSMYTAAPGTIAASPLAYSGYAYNPYSAMHYSQATWAYQAGYMPGYMPDLSSMQAYQNMALQSYPMMASAQVVPTVDMMQALQPATATSDEVLPDGAIAIASSAGVLDESKTGSGKKVNRPPKNTRVYIFKNDSALSKEVERYLDNIGLKKFDLYNLTLLRHLPNFECLIFIQQDDSKYVNQIPGLLRLKRDLRVVFVTYNLLDDVMNKQYTMIFPRAGMVLMDESALIACKSEVLDGLCQFMRKQTFEKGTAWKLLITSNTFKILDQLTSVEENLFGYQLEDDIEEHVRITEVSQILQTYKTSGIVEVLSDEFHMSDPKSTADYQACFLALQRARHGSCRHFLFVTDMPRNHPDAKMFLTNGIDIMNVVEFMRCFVSKAVVHSPKVFESFVTRYTPEKYLDAPISDCSQTITF